LERKEISLAVTMESSMVLFGKKGMNISRNVL
jgi:hypothetical protein